MPASCSASSPASRARCAPGMSLNMPKRTMPMPATATPSNRRPCFMTAAPDAGRRADVTGGAEAVDHHVVAVLVLAQRLEVDLDLHADGEVVRPAREDRLHPRPFGQVDLGHAVAGHVGVLLAEQRDVAVGPGVDRAAGRELDVLGALVQALGAHEPPREEHLAAGGTAAPEQPRRLGRVVGDPEEPFFNGDSGHALLASIGPSVRCRSCLLGDCPRCHARCPPSTGRAAAACRACRWGLGAWPR